MKRPARQTGRVGTRNSLNRPSFVCRLATLLQVLSMAVLVGCDRLDMYDQPRYEPLEASSFLR